MGVLKTIGAGACHGIWDERETHIAIESDWLDLYSQAHVSDGIPELLHAKKQKSVTMQ